MSLAAGPRILLSIVKVQVRQQSVIHVRKGVFVEARRCCKVNRDGVKSFLNETVILHIRAQWQQVVVLALLQPVWAPFYATFGREAVTCNRDT